MDKFRVHFICIAMLKKSIVLTGISTICFLFIVFHFTIVNIYGLPKQWKSPELEKKTYSYILPFFHQNWGVFAPVPREEGRLFYQYYTENGWSEEFSFKEQMALKNHVSAERIADMVCYYLSQETRLYAKKEGEEMDYTQVKNSPYYGRVLYAVHAHVKHEQLGQEPDSMRLILERDLFPKKGYSAKKTIRDYFKPDSF